ncbi:MAG: hypothetical protein ACR2NP_01665 [Pirellulaceae bacterium]
MSNQDSNYPEAAVEADTRSQSNACPEQINAAGLARFASWIDSELDNLLEANNDWHTPQSNRKYFGR